MCFCDVHVCMCEMWLMSDHVLQFQDNCFNVITQQFAKTVYPVSAMFISGRSFSQFLADLLLWCLRDFVQ
jgi:hypothetical protein